MLSGSMQARWFEMNDALAIALSVARMALDFLQGVLTGQISESDAKVVGTEIRQIFARYVKASADAAELAKFGPEPPDQ